MKIEDLLITRLPTLVNTDKMGIKELREQYKLLEGDAISQAQQLSDVCAQLARNIQTLQDYNITFATLCDSYEAGDQSAILLMLKKLSEKRRDFNEKKAKVH
ncbi:MAG: hypothetical protein AB1722_12410 [Pseudomonadota bacterium]